MVFEVGSMSKSHGGVIEYYVSPIAEGDAEDPRLFPSLQRALVEISRRHVTAAGGDGASAADCLQIVHAPGPHAAPRRGPARYCYFIDPHWPAQDADGTEGAPWPDLSTALLCLAELHESGRLQLDSGERILIARRNVFAPSVLERRKQRFETAVRWLLGTTTVALAAPMIAILVYLVVRAWPVLHWEFLTTNPQNFMTAGGIWAPLVGTFLVSLLSLAMAAPIGVLAGIYLNEYAPDNWFTRVVNLAVINLAGVPSIVHGLFGVAAFVTAVRWLDPSPAATGKSLLAAAATLAVMTLPVIITSTREALASVPTAFREACWNVGASRWQTIRSIVLPNSISGILTGVIFQVARAAGETAPILFTGAVIFTPVPDSGWASYVPYGMRDQFMELSFHLYNITQQISNVPEEVKFGTAVVLIGLVLVFNSISIGARIYLRARKKW
jgi:phosphate transport system permease protein